MHYWAIKAVLGRQTLWGFSLFCAVCPGEAVMAKAHTPCCAALLISAGLQCWATGCAGAALRAACRGHRAGLSDTGEPSLHHTASCKRACDHPAHAGKEGQHGMRRGSFGVFGESPYGANNIPPADWCCRGIKSSERGFDSNRRQSCVSVHRLKHGWTHAWAKEGGRESLACTKFKMGSKLCNMVRKTSQGIWGWRKGNRKSDS